MKRLSRRRSSSIGRYIPMGYDKYRLKHTTLDVPAFRCFVQMQVNVELKIDKPVIQWARKCYVICYVKFMIRPIFPEEGLRSDRDCSIDVM
jgi:hypothetical protein